MALRGFSYVLYNVFLYHLLYRSGGSWERVDMNLWNLQVLAQWMASPRNVAAALLAIVGCWPAAGDSASLREERRLCGFLVAGLAIYLVLPRPTFVQYFVLLVPFLSILAAFGVSTLGSRWWPRPPMALSTAAVALFLLVWAARLASHGYGQALHSGDWPEFEDVAAHVNRVTAAGAPIYADRDAIYFVARRIPPPGLERSFAREQKVPPKVAQLLHFTPQEQFNQWLAQGRYDTVVLSSGSEEARQVDLKSIYRRSRTIGDYTIFWDRAPGSR